MLLANSTQVPVGTGQLAPFDNRNLVTHYAVDNTVCRTASVIVARSKSPEILKVKMWTSWKPHLVQVLGKLKSSKDLNEDTLSSRNTHTY